MSDYKPPGFWAYMALAFFAACFISEVFIFHHTPGIIIWEAAFLLQLNNIQEESK